MPPLSLQFCLLGFVDARCSHFVTFLYFQCLLFSRTCCIYVTGISQLPALLTLMRLYTANVDLCNVDGMSPLMLAASSGDCILVNVSSVNFLAPLDVAFVCLLTKMSETIAAVCRHLLCGMACRDEP